VTITDAQIDALANHLVQGLIARGSIKPKVNEKDLVACVVELMSSNFETEAKIAKLAANRFGLAFRVRAEVTQACVVTLEPVSSFVESAFHRELVFVGSGRHRQGSEAGLEVVVEGDVEEGPEEIDSLHVDLAAPALEEFALALDPYPRRPGVEFAPKNRDPDHRESPFAALKDLK